MGNKSDQTREFLTTLVLALLCIVPFVLTPLKNWYIILILFNLPIIFISIFRLLSDETGSNSKPKQLWNVSYIFVGLMVFFTSMVVFYLNNYSWSNILLYSAGIGGLAIIIAMISIIIWRKFYQAGTTRQE